MSTPIRVFKFGGASVKDAAAVRNMASIIYSHGTQNNLLVVVSAMGKTTNALEVIYQTYRDGSDYKSLVTELLGYHQHIATELFPEPEAEIHTILKQLFLRLEATLERQSKTEAYDEGYDQIVSFGEVISTRIVAYYLRSINAAAIWQDARHFIQTDNTWREGRLDWDYTEKVIASELPLLLQNQIVITQGFIGGTVDQMTTTLGREGSDYTASIFASCLNAESLSIWKDVPGVLTGDPKRYAEANLHTELSYLDAAEMTYYGATVIHPKTIRPLAAKNIPLYVRSFIHPEQPGTKVSNTKTVESLPSLIYKGKQALLVLRSRDLSFVSDKSIQNVVEDCSRILLKVNMLQVAATSLSIVVDSDSRKLEKLITSLEDKYVIDTVEGLELLTVKDYNLPLIEKLMAGKEPTLTQKTLTTYQAVYKV